MGSEATSTLAHVHETTEEVASVEMTPPHPPRTETPEYAKAHRFLVNTKNSPCIVCGVTKRTLKNTAKNPAGATQIETHHYPVERSLVDACDPRKVHRDFPAVYDRATLTAWVDSPANLIVLCLTGDSPVLLADGSYRPITDVRVGDYLIGHDGNAHRVTATLRRHIEEDIVEVDGVRLTGNHPVLTPSGWKRADQLVRGEVVGHVGMEAPHVLGMTRTQFEVFESVVRAVPIEMVDALRAGERAPHVLLHHPAMLHHGAPALQRLVPDPTAHISLWRQEEAAQTLGTLTRCTVEANHAAVIGAIPSRGLFGRLGRERRAADRAGQRRVLHAGRLLPHATALSRAGGVAVCDMGRHEVLIAADDARLSGRRIRPPALDAFWRPINHLRSLPFYGTVYDIELEGSHSFVANGTIVHNCDVHHRSLEAGIHHLLTQDWVIQKYLLPGYTVAARPSDAAAVLAADQRIVTSPPPAA